MVVLRKKGCNWIFRWGKHVTASWFFFNFTHQTWHKYFNSNTYNVGISVLYKSGQRVFVFLLTLFIGQYLWSKHMPKWFNVMFLCTVQASEPRIYIFFNSESNWIAHFSKILTGASAVALRKMQIHPKKSKYKQSSINLTKKSPGRVTKICKKPKHM